SGSALHLAGLLPRPVNRTLRWMLETRRQAWALFLLFCWGYFDLTVSAMLSPIGVTPVTVRLYNLMHYGHTPVLSALVCATTLAPVAIVVAARLTRGLWMNLGE